VKKEILSFLEKDNLVYKKPDSLFMFMANFVKAPVEEVKKVFKKMLKNGEIFQLNNGRYIPLPSKGYAKAKFIGTKKGFGFCDVGDGNDVFIPVNKINGAIDGDEVVVKVLNQSEEGKDGEVVQILQKVNRVVGTIMTYGKNVFVIPDNEKLNFNVILKKSYGLQENDKVVVDIERMKNGKVQGNVIETLGKSDDIKTLELAIIRENGLYESFPKEVVEASDKIPQEVLPVQKQGRVDFTKETTFTIDGEDARDFDDAISISKTPEGYVLGVHIADVGEYVEKDSVIDEEAFKRGTSTYFPTSVLPMLPTSLSNGICSLNEGEERLTLSCIMHIDHEGNVQKHSIVEGVIKSNARLTYTEVFGVINNDENATEKARQLEDKIFLMKELTEILLEKRKDRGAVDFELPETEFVFNDEGIVVDCQKRERNLAHMMIEEFMVLANITVAKEFFGKHFPFVYRVHEAPTKEKAESVRVFMQGLGENVPKVPKNITSDYYQSLSKKTEGKDYYETVSKVLLRSMQKAKYTSENLGHFNLALEHYCHFTSPIRRYPDLTIHRFIKDQLHKKLSASKREEFEEFAEESSLQSSETERKSEKSERDVDDLWKAYLMKDKVGQEFDGIITSVLNFGFFVELENSCEGLVKVETLPPDAYLYLEKSLQLKGQNHSYKIGDKVRVKVVASNIYTRKIDFELAGMKKSKTNENETRNR